MAFKRKNVDVFAAWRSRAALAVDIKQSYTLFIHNLLDRCR